MALLTHVLARFTAGLRYEDIPDDSRTAAKRLLYDTIGCALGGLKQEDPAIYLKVLSFLGGNPQATILGTGRRLSLVHATLINSLLVRVMDYNDIYWVQDPSHPSDLIPAALSVGEHLDRSGRDVLTAIVVAYEIEMRLCEFAVPGIRERGWHHATWTQVASPYAAGKLLDLDVEQLVNAAGISASCHVTTGSVTAGKLTMMKNTVDPLAAAAGVEAALLAKEGFTGPEHVLDGKEGLMHLLGEGWDAKQLTESLGREFRTPLCGVKPYPTEALTHAPISAILDLIREHRLRPDDIASVAVKTIARAADILSDPSKYDPRTKETADHSLPYCLAAACARARVTPEEFTQASIDDPAIRGFLPRIQVSAEPDYEALFPRKQPSLVRVTTRSGPVLEKYVEYPKGHPTVPMSEDELVAKFASLASPEMDRAHAGAVYDLVMGFDGFDSMQPLLDAIRIR